MKYLSVNGNYEEEQYVDPEASGGWKDSGSARKSPSVPSGPEMPPGYEPQAKNEFGTSLSDGNTNAEAFDCGYRNPYLSDPNMRKARREEMAAENADGFVTRNNYWERM